MNFFAYIDPGAGTMLVQALLAGLLAIPFFFRSTFSRTIERLRGRVNVKQNSEHDSPE